MSCSCDRLDSIMKLLKELKSDIGLVKKDIGILKTKCIRIEKEILGITAESDINADAVMETTTVRHLVEKLSYDVDKLTMQNNKAISSAAERENEIAAAREGLHEQFSEATSGKIEELKLKYDVVAQKTFEIEFLNFLKEFRSQAAKALIQSGFSSSVIHDLLEDVAGTSNSYDLYVTHFLNEYKQMECVIQEMYEEVIEAYAKKAVGRMRDFYEIGQEMITEFLNKFKFCDNSFARFQEELADKLQEITEQIESNRCLLDRLTKEFRDRMHCKKIVYVGSKDIGFNAMTREIKVSYPKLIEIFIEKLSRQMDEETTAWSNGRITFSYPRYFE